MRRHKFQIVLAAESGLTHDEAVRCLRAALKALGRCYGLQCSEAVEVTAQNEPQRTNEGQRDE